MIYLAAPYGTHDPQEKAHRMHCFYRVDSILSLQGKVVVSPLYKVATARDNQIPDTWAFWQNYSYELLSKCDEMIVIPLFGWDTSTGVMAEIEFCKKNNIPYSLYDGDMGHGIPSTVLDQSFTLESSVDINRAIEEAVEQVRDCAEALQYYDENKNVVNYTGADMKVQVTFALKR